MTEPKFTPGPWKVESDEEEIIKGECARLITGNNYEIAYVFEPANARLIAAAPDMYSALKEAMRHIPTDYDDQLKARKMITALLARIDGEE